MGFNSGFKGLRDVFWAFYSVTDAFRMYRNEQILRIWQGECCGLRSPAMSGLHLLDYSVVVFSCSAGVKANKQTHIHKQQIR